MNGKVSFNSLPDSEQFCPRTNLTYSPATAIHREHYIDGDLTQSRVDVFPLREPMRITTKFMGSSVLLITLTALLSSSGYVIKQRSEQRLNQTYQQAHTLVTADAFALRYGTLRCSTRAIAFRGVVSKVQKAIVQEMLKAAENQIQQHSSQQAINR